MRGLLLLLAALLVGAVGAAGAQTAELQPSAAQQCLLHVDGEGQQPDYPIADYNAGKAGRVQVVFEFAQADRPPELTFLLQQGGERFVEAVKKHARGLRVPCLDAANAPARLSVDFVFDPGTQQVSSSEAQDPEHQRRSAMLRCIVHAKGWRVPEYPEWARRRSLQGRVLVRASYTNATEPPRLEAFARPYAVRLAEEMMDWMKDTRLPCQSGAPITGVWTFIFVLNDERYGFNELGFRQFLLNVKGIREQTLQIDTNTMGCPFDVQLSYRRPDLPNDVSVVGAHNAARRPLLAWLAASELDLPRRTLDSIWGDTARITIPCLKIDLKPKEKS